MNRHTFFRFARPVLLGLFVCVVLTLGISGTAWAVRAPEQDQQNGTVPKREADLSVTKTATRTGNTIKFKIVVKNNGPAFAPDVETADELPGQVSYQSASTSKGTCKRNGNKVTCNARGLAVGESLTVTITTTLKDNQAKKLQNTGRSESDIPDPNKSNNKSTIVMQLR